MHGIVGKYGMCKFCLITKKKKKNLGKKKKKMANSFTPSEVWVNSN